MNAPRALVRLAVALAIGSQASSAVAAEPASATSTPPKTEQAVELTAAGGYVLAPSTYGGHGPRGPAQGAGADFGIGVRMRRWSLGVVGEVAELSRDGDETHITSAKGSVAASAHLLPEARFDPWAGFSAGYVYVGHATASAHGIELGRLAVGIDLRISPLVAVAPTLSYGLDVFPWRESDLRWYGTMFAGLTGRFDLSPSVIGD